jgi:hypothetical protein
LGCDGKSAKRQRWPGRDELRRIEKEDTYESLDVQRPEDRERNMLVKGKREISDKRGRDQEQ